MSTFIDNIENLRYNPFTQTYTPFGYGYSGNDKEVHTIPSSSPYWIYLNEIPREDSPSTLFVNEQGGGSFTEVSFTTSPATNQFRVVYGSDGTTTVTTAGQGIVEFNSADAGKTVEVQYYGLGFILDKKFVNNTLKVSNPIGTIIPVHPDTKSAYLPDSEYWAACDGVTDLNTTYFNTGNDTKVPDLTDDRFLMGDNTYGSAGSNNLASHTHSHNHKWHQVNNSSTASQSYNSGGTLTDISFTVGGGSAVNAILAAQKNTGGYLDTDYYTATDSTTSSVVDNKPQYFSVLFYMRIN